MPGENRVGSRTALARALGFAHWHQLAKSLPPEFSAEFQTKVLKLNADPTAPKFLSAVKRFANSSGIDLVIAHALCVEFLPEALEKWHNWKDRSPDIEKLPERNAKVWDGAHAQRFGSEDRESNPPLLAALAGHAGVQLVNRGQPVPVVVRKRRHAVQPGNRWEMLR
ncbi:MAG: hypothetical protein Q8M11_06390 [Sulfuritalea sp.]|nr:hypothetical protein [Sulfuritalea sp.]MDP1982123.1 hypothetical protein [Sulfuritalea sp.]